MVKIAVIGAGIVGLTTAVKVQDALPEAKVTIIADKFMDETTSSGAGGFFKPLASFIKGVSGEDIKNLVQTSWDYFSSLSMSSLAEETGQSLVFGYVVSDDRDFVENPIYSNIVFNFNILSPVDMARLRLPCKYGSSFQTVITQTKKFMPWLMNLFTANGGKVLQHSVCRIEELAGSYDIVVNCSALGSVKIVPDSSVYPVKGHIVKLRAPWIKHFLYCDGKEVSYFIPHDDCLLVGGNHGEGNCSLTIESHETAGIMERAERILPQITGAEVVGEWAGLRPCRDPLRLEKQLLIVNNRKLRIVHNYGHGANGVTLSWGTATVAAQLVREWADELQ